MKKLLVLFAALLVLLLCACGGEEGESASAAPAFTVTDFTEGSHKRSEEYMASFKTRSLEYEGLRIHIAADLFDEELSPAFASGLMADYLALRQLDESIAAGGELYIVSMTTTGGPVWLEGRLYVTPGDVESGDCLAYMARMVYGTEKWWQCKGLALAALGDFPDEQELGRRMAEYLGENPDSGLLSLHPCYFLNEFADEATVALVESISHSLTEFILKKDGVAALLSEDSCAAMTEEWLGKMNVAAEMPQSGSLDKMAFSVTGEAPMVLSCRNYKLNMHSVDWMPDAEAAYRFLADFCSGADRLYARFEAEAPEFYFALAADTDVTAVQFRPGDYPISSRASMLKAEAVVTDDADVLHEICHTLMPRASIDEAYWLCEGLVTYLTAPYVSYSFDSIVVDSVLTEHPEDTDEDRFFRGETVRCFEKLNGFGISVDMTEPIYRIYEAAGYAAFLNPGNTSMPAATQSIQDNYAERHAYNLKGAYPGNELSYCQSMIFVDWLVEKYGLERIILAQTDSGTYKELFPDAAAFEMEFALFWDARVAPLIE